MSAIRSHATQPCFSSILGLILLLSKSVGKSVDPSRKEKDSPLCNKTHVCHVPAKKRTFFFYWRLPLAAPAVELSTST